MEATIEYVTSPWAVDSTKIGFVLLLKELLNHHSIQSTIIQVSLANTQTGIQSRNLVGEEAQFLAYFSLFVNNAQMRIKNFLQPTPWIMLFIFFLVFKGML